MQYSPYYNTYKAYITYMLNISVYVAGSKFVMWKICVKFVCENNV